MRITSWVITVLTFLVSPSLEVADPCSPSPCGQNTSCRASAGRAVCSCLPGHRGSPLTACLKGDCTVSEDCPSHKACINSQCQDVCAGNCGINARCEARNRVPVCSCPAGYTGDPFVHCRSDPESLCSPNPCGRNAQCKVVNNVPTCSCLPELHRLSCWPECTACSADRPVCWYGRCIDPCSSACGVNASRATPPSAAAPRATSATPWCTDDDYCNPNPCGDNAVCQPGFDDTGKRRPVCTCPRGYVGNALWGCRRGECLSDAECRPHLRCDAASATCRDPCQGACGLRAECAVRNHVPLCACPAGYTGDASAACQPLARVSESLLTVYINSQFQR